MIQMESILKTGDNSGAKSVKCIKVLGGSKKAFARTGDIIVVSIKEAIPNSKVKKGEVLDAVVVRTIKEGNEPIGTRIFGPISREVRVKGFVRIASLAPEVF